MVRAAYLAMDFIARFVIVPLLFAALLIGLVQSLGTTPRVLTKFLLTIAPMIVLLLQMEGIGSVAALAADTSLSSADLRGLRTSVRTHAAGGLVVLLVLVALSIYKPKGVTRYGWRKQHEQRLDPGPRRATISLILDDARRHSFCGGLASFLHVVWRRDMGAMKIHGAAKENTPRSGVGTFRDINVHLPACADRDREFRC